MAEGTLARPQQGVGKMKEVSGTTGQVGGGNEVLLGGVYRHPQTGEEIIALDDPITGDAQARGYVRAGFEWVRDVKESEIKTVGLVSQDFEKQPERQLSLESEELKGLRARLAVLEAQEDKRKEQEGSPHSTTEQAQEEAQKAAQQKTEERGVDNSGDVPTSGGVNHTLDAQEEVNTSKATEEEEVKSDDETKPRRGRPAKENK